MGFSPLFILQLRSWHHGQGPPDSDSGPDLFDLLIFDLLLLLLSLDLLLQHLHLSALDVGADTLISAGLARRCNFFQSASGPRPSCQL